MKSKVNQQLENVMDRTRAAVAFCNTQSPHWNKEAGEVFAFLSVIHPEIPLARRLKLAKEMSE